MIARHPHLIPFHPILIHLFRWGDIQLYNLVAISQLHIVEDINSLLGSQPILSFPATTPRPSPSYTQVLKIDVMPKYLYVTGLIVGLYLSRYEVYLGLVLSGPNRLSQLQFRSGLFYMGCFSPIQAVINIWGFRKMRSF